MGSNIQSNLKKLADLRLNNPGATHVFVRRVGMDNEVIDIPINGAEMTLKRHPFWEVVTTNRQMDEEVEKLFNE